jgi:imidazolonepropionase-like amidohydrolase
LSLPVGNRGDDEAEAASGTGDGRRRPPACRAWAKEPMGMRAALIGPILALVAVAACGTWDRSPSAGPTRLEPSPTAAPASLAFVNGTLIDGAGHGAEPDAVIVVDGRRIAAAGPRDTVTIPDGTPIVDVAGGTILPGFINAHVHGSDDRRALATWAGSGVTTVRDLGSDRPQADLFAMRNEASQDPGLARLVAAGPMLTVPGGYGSLPVTSPSHARQTVTELLDAGADLVKVGIEDDLQGRRWTLIPIETLTAIVETAHARGVPVAAHVSRSRHVELALQAGVDDVVHMIVDELPDELAARMVRDGMQWVPTLELWQCVQTLHQVDWDDRAIASLRRFVAAGGSVALGTDFGGYRCAFDEGMPVTEIGLMREADMSPMQIIMAATRNAARVSNLGDALGTLEPGREADILVVAGNPLDDLGALADVRWVVHGGVVIRSPSGG